MLPAPQLFVVLRCDDLRAPASRHALAHVDEVWLGRGPALEARRSLENGVRQLHLTLPDRRMSRRHARLARSATGWQLFDLGSSNGTRVNGHELSAADSGGLLDDGALIEVGATFLRLRTALPTPATAPGDLHAGELDALPSALRSLLPELAAGFERLVRVARSPLPVLLLGETGTGKELLARSLHAGSGRSGAFVALNCGALPESLVEAQLFGHVRGAFSGASRDELGYVRAADGGSLFLDEIGDLPRASQTALLRVLQEGEVVPVGSTRAIAVDARVLSATHARLPELATAGEFREDLFARLAGFVFQAPPLRERREDLGLIMAALAPALEAAAGGTISLQPAAARALLQYAWPRNVRELQKALASALVLSESRCIEAALLPESVRAGAPAADGGEGGLEAELRAHFARHRGNVTQVAKAMGKARVQIQRWMKRFGIDPSQFR